MATKDEQAREAMSQEGIDPNASYRPGFSGMGNIGAVYTPTSGVALGDSGKQIGYRVEPAADENTYRVGDYTWTGAGYSLVPNSPTDIFYKYVTSDAENRQGLSTTDWFNAASKGVLAWSGLPTNDPSGMGTAADLLGAAGTAAAGQLMKGNAATRLLWAAGNFLQAINDADQKHLDEYLNQDFNYELAGKFDTDENGKTIFRPEYSKMADAGPESGSAVKEAQDTSDTKVSMAADNALTVQVTPVFAESDIYKELLQNIKDNYGSLSMDEANEVVDKDTGKTRLDILDALVKSAESNYLYNVQTVKQIKEKAPTASNESLNLGTEVSKVGYLSEESLKDTTIKIYNESNELTETNAKEWLDSVASKDKIGRENYMLSLGNRIADKNISDNEKAVLYGQSIALYAASDSSGPYNGMYQKSWTDAIGSSSDPLFGLQFNQYFGGTELTTFRDDELASGLLTIAGTIGSVKALTAATNLAEKGLRKVTPKLSNWAGESMKGVLESSEGDAGQLKTIASIAGKTATQVGYQIAADAMYDASKLIPYAMTGNIDQYDFLKELETDFVMDMLATYGPGQYVAAINSPKSEYRILAENTKTGELEYKRLSDIKKAGDTYKILESDTGMRDAKLVEITADELVARRAETLDKLTNSKIGLKVQELFFDKNAALTKLAVQIRKVSGQYHYRKMLRYSNDIRQVTSDTLREFLAKENVAKNWESLGASLRENGQTIKDFSEEDWNYIKAVTNEYRFLEKQKGDKKAEEVIKNFYKDAKEGVSKERAAQLDSLMGSMRVVASDVLDYLVEKGLMTQKQADELRNSPGYQNGMYLPMYMVAGKKISGDISQDRVPYKRVKNEDALISLDDIDNPMNSLARYVNNAMRAVAMNDRNLAIREAASMAGVGIRVVKDSGGALREVKNLKAMSSEFNKIFKGIVASTRKALPTIEQWQETNSRLVLRSQAYKSAGTLGKLQDEAKDLRKQLRNEKRRKEPNANKIRKLQKQIADNKQAQLQTADDIKRYIGLVMERAQKAHKGSKAKLDISSYLNVQVTNSLKSALKSGNMVGEVQKVINDAVDNANPWVDPDVVIRSRAAAAAEKFREKVAKDMASQKKTLGDKFNMAVDRAMDKIMEKVTGERETEVTFVDDEGYTTKMLDNYGQKNVIRYMLNGEVNEMKLEGVGAEELVAEVYAPEFSAPKTVIGKIGHRLNEVSKRIAQAKRYLTTSADVTRALPNLSRDWGRGIVSTSGNILLSPDKLFNEMAEQYNYSPEQTKLIKNGLMLARGAVQESTLTASLQMPSKNRSKNMIRAMTEPDGNAFTRFIYDLKAGDIGKILSRPQDTAEAFTRKRAMDTAYYKTLADAQSRGLSVEDAIKEATEAAYFYGREATTNFYRRGKFVGAIAQNVPYLSQRFANIESFKYAYLDNPIGVTRSLRTTVSAYTALIAIALSNEESRQKYFMLSDYDRANNIIIPIDNGSIMTIPLDETIAAFLTPYRRMTETLHGVDPEAFYLCFAEGLEALSPIDLSGFSEGDGFNVVRGFEKIGAEFAPTWVQPFIEMWTGRDLYYGSALAIDSEYTGSVYGNWTPTPGELTTKGKNSQTLKGVADHTGIPQWILQNFLSEYGGNIGQYMLNTIDKISGATEEAQGGKEWLDSVFKPFTGSDSDNVSSQFYNAISALKEDKKNLQNELATISKQMESATGEAKAELLNKRQEKINAYGLKVTDKLNEFLSAYNITGGLSKSQANQAWYLYKIYDDDFNAKMYLPESSGGYYTDKATDYASHQATNLAALSGADTLVRNPVNDYYDSYAEQAFKNTVYGYGAEQMAELANILEDTSDYNNSLTKLRSDVKKARSEAYQKGDYTTMSALAYNYDRKIANAIYPYLLQHGVAETLDNTAVMKYLKDWFIVPSEEQKTAYGKYVPNLGTDSEKSEAFKKQFIKKIFGVSGQ